MTALEIQSHKGPYTVHFDEGSLKNLNEQVPADAHFIIDERVAGLYRDQMPAVLEAPSVLQIEATELNKSLDKFPAYVDHLVGNGVRRGHCLVAIGGGIIQDITCFLAATMLRGLDWRFYPTTLLAQADSCIGSKSSINAGSAKNILGTFTPPKEIWISGRFLDTLDPRDVRSGIGEIIKVHVIAGPDEFNKLAADFERLETDRAVLLRYMRRALEIKKSYIERDEFDQGPRLVFNYGHSFGHALEAATEFAVPHGIAVTIGMDMANWLASQLGVGDPRHFERMHDVLRRNYAGYQNTDIPLDRFLASLAKDKKNTGTGQVTLILPDKKARIFRDGYANDAGFKELCGKFFTTVLAAA